MNPQGFNYVVVSPVKDEERYIGATIDSVTRQTVKPSRWIIVDDGSTDRTSEIIATRTKDLSWVTVVTVQRGAPRFLGLPVMAAFMRGYVFVESEPFEFVVKLDCDLELPSDYFEKLLAKFREDKSLGIGSGVYLEENDRGWEAVVMPEYHAAGASKVVRADCYRQIGGFVLSPGWDTVDEIKARALGWKTSHFEDLAFRHLKPEGSGSGYFRTSLKCGEIDYLSGAGWCFVAIKSLHRMVVGRPILLGGLALMTGFLMALFTGRPKLVSPDEAKLYRQLLNRRMWESFRTFGKRLQIRVWSYN